MTEESLNQLSLNELLDVMVVSINELLVMNKGHESISIVKAKQKEVEMMQRIIKIKKEEAQTPE